MPSTPVTALCLLTVYEQTAACSSPACRSPVLAPLPWDVNRAISGPIVDRFYPFGRTGNLISSTSHHQPPAGLFVRSKKTTFHGWLGRHHTIQWLRLVAFLFESHQSMDGWLHADLCLCYDLCDRERHTPFNTNRETGEGEQTRKMM